MTSAEAARLTRWSTTAATWVRKATSLMYSHYDPAVTEEERWAVGYYAARLLDDVLDDAWTLAEMVPDDMVEEIARRAEGVAKQMRSRRLAAKLRNVEGRTPEEAEAFLARASELERA